MATLSKTDRENLTSEQQKQILALKEQYAAATNAADKDAIHQQAEAIRATAGYSGGTSGNQNIKPSGSGKTADQMKAYLEEYTAANYDPEKGWVNGYSTAMNTRSMANAVRQQMLANSQAWHNADEETKNYLHEQNVELSKLLGAESKYDPVTGKWSTWNTNLGYGDNLNWTQPNIASAWKNYYGYTDEDRKNWDADTGRYYNFVDTRAPKRNAIDESSGYTGQYSQFVNGPYGQLLYRGTNHLPKSVYSDVIGDGFGLEGADLLSGPQYDAEGNLIKTAPQLKNNNALTDYTAQFVPYAQNGVIGSGQQRDMPDFTAADPNNMAGQIAYAKQYGSLAGSSSGGTNASYLNRLYDAALEAQLAQLQSDHLQNLSELDSSLKQIGDTYAEQRRQTESTAAQSAAAWRELANAQGLNSGAVGQAVLAQNNRLRSDLNSLLAAQASAQAEIEQQRALLGQQYRLAIQKAQAENNYQKVQALYEEAVRAEESLIEQQQFQANLALQIQKLLLQ